MMKKFLVVLMWIALGTMGVVAQQRLVNEVKKEISGLTPTVESYKNSLKKIVNDKSTLHDAGCFSFGLVGENFGLMHKFFGLGMP